MFSLALSLAYFWTGREEGGSWIVTAWLKSKMAGANTVSFTQKGLCKLQAHSKRRGVRNGDQMGTLYLECCKAKVHLLYVAYSKRMEHSIYLHMVTVIWIWGSLSPVGPWCSRLMILQKADLSETLKVPVHFGGWAVMTLPKTESTPLRQTGWSFLTSPFLLFMVRSSDVWQGNLGLTPGSRNGLSRTRETSWKHSCTSRLEGVWGKQGEALKGCLEEGVGVVCCSHWKPSSGGVHGDQSWYPAIDSPRGEESEHGIFLACFWQGHGCLNSHLCLIIDFNLLCSSHEKIPIDVRILVIL